MRKLLAVLLCLTLLPLACAQAAITVAPVLEITAPEETVRPGKAIVLTFEVPQAGNVSLVVENAEGETVSVVVEDHAAQEGRNQLYWNGTWQGEPAPEGEYTLMLRMGDSVATAPVSIGSVAPYLYGWTVENDAATPDEPILVRCTPSENGMLHWGAVENGEVVDEDATEVTAGESYEVAWQPGETELSDGEYPFEVWLTDETGFESTREQLRVTITGYEAAPAMASADEAAMDENLPAEEDAAQDTPLPDVEETPATDGDMAVPEAVDTEPATQDTADGAQAELALEELPLVEEHEQLDDGQMTSTATVYTPSYGSPYTEAVKENDYWTTPMDITDEEAVWKMLTSPMTVVDNGKKNAQKTQVILRKEPDEESAGVGVVTCISQSVRVLETLDNGWSLVEIYSSSFHDNTVKAWNMLVQGYVPTKYLKTETPNQTMGIVIDKLTQRLYLFKDGALYDTLLVSTGLANEKQPYNETRSGEFLLMLPAVGGFKSDNLVCSMGIRFNDGDLLHEVPHTVNKDGSNNYATCEPKLGVKASHGCIRVQRRQTSKGTNMKWLWDNIRSIGKKQNVKMVIWEDWQGRQISYPQDDTPLYYNPNGGKQYHTAETCYSAKGKTFVAFTYGQLEDEEFAKLERCTWCTAPLRKAEIDEINAVYAPGGDHDPVLTAARQKWLDSQAGN